MLLCRESSREDFVSKLEQDKKIGNKLTAKSFFTKSKNCVVNKFIIFHLIREFLSTCLASFL